MKLASILDPNLIFTGVGGNYRHEVYGEMLRRAREVLPELSASQVLEGLVEREDSLCIPYDGAALPHLRLPEFKDLHVLIGILDKPLKIKDCDATPSQLVIMSLVSPETSDVYLKSLSAFVRYLGKPANRAALIAAADGNAALKVIEDAQITLRKTLTAEDLMTSDVNGISPDSPLAVALDRFSRERRQILPVIDPAGKLLGQLDAIEVIKRFIPGYIFMMDNLNFLTSFEPFEKIFKEENKHKVADFMTPPALTIPGDTPLIQFTVPLVRRETSTIFVLDSEQKLIGELTIRNIIENVLRG